MYMAVQKNEGRTTWLDNSTIAVALQCSNFIYSGLVRHISVHSIDFFSGYGHMEGLRYHPGKDKVSDILLKQNYTTICYSI